MQLAFSHAIGLGFRGSLFTTAQTCRRVSPVAKRDLNSPGAMTTTATATEGPTLYVKAGPDGQMGDCPFSQKANLALHFRNVDVNVHTVDLSNKPQWFLDLNDAGSTPVFQDGMIAIADSDEIVDHADAIGDGVVLNREDDANWDGAFDAVSPVFGSLVRLLKNKDDAETQRLKDALASALRSLDSFLKSVDGLFLLGHSISALDCNLAPKLKHVNIAAKHYCDFDIPPECDALLQYMQHFEQTDEWKATACTDDVIVWGWSKFFQ